MRTILSMCVAIMVLVLTIMELLFLIAAVVLPFMGYFVAAILSTCAMILSNLARKELR